MSTGPLGALLEREKRLAVDVHGFVHQAAPADLPAVTPGNVAAELREAACARTRSLFQPNARVRVVVSCAIFVFFPRFIHLVSASCMNRHVHGHPALGESMRVAAPLCYITPQ